MNKSEQIGELAAALVEAQKVIHNVVKNKTNPFFAKTDDPAKGKYADLSSVAEACKEPLNTNGICYVQSPEPGEKGVVVLTTTLLHKSGQWISGTCAVPLDKVGPQAYGSAMTYARRYGLSAMVGVCPEDDDGEGAEGRQTPKGRPAAPPAKPVNAPAVSEQRKIQLDELLDAKGFSDEAVATFLAATCTKHKVPYITDLPEKTWTAMLDAVNKDKVDRDTGKAKK